MEERIFQLIHDYSTGKKSGDKEFIKELIRILYEYNNLKGYLKRVSFNNKEVDENEDKIPACAYDHSSMELTIRLPALYFEIDCIQKVYCLPLSYLEKLMFRYFILAQSIMHEFEHIKQRKRYDDKSDDSLDAKLIRADYEKGAWIGQFLKDNPSSEDLCHFLSSYDNQLYLDNWIICPTERMAECDSFLKLAEVMYGNIDQLPNLFTYHGIRVLSILKSNYEEAWKEDMTCPTELYLRKNSQGFVWKGLPFYDPNREQLVENAQKQYSLRYRLSRGLPCSKGEYHNNSVF